ncbi:hypothetical protein N752_29380 [Desulforamulus aquiferis]|nr:hypothetical protein N752_29380 [Desulforamulus aquiferis]
MCLLKSEIAGFSIQPLAGKIRNHVEERLKTRYLPYDQIGVN